MKNTIVLVLCLAAFSLNAQQTIEGSWNTGQENTIIEIKKVNDAYEGIIVASDNPKAQLGKVLIKDIAQVKKGYAGKLYAMKKQKWMDVNLTPNEETLELEVGSGLRKKTIEWEKAE